MISLLTRILLFSVYIITALPTSLLDDPNIDSFEQNVMRYFHDGDVGKDELRNMVRLISDTIIEKEIQLDNKNKLIGKNLREIAQMKNEITLIRKHQNTQPLSSIQ